MVNHAVIHWEPAADLAGRNLQVTGQLRLQRNCTPVGFGKWEKRHFSCHKRPGFTLPKIGDLMCLNNLPKGKNLLLGVQPLGAEGTDPTWWMCPCGWTCRVGKPAR